MLTSLQNPLVKQIRKLHQAKQRQRQQLFLLEGTHLLEEACKAGYSLMSVCCTPAWRDAHIGLWERVCLQAERFELVTPEILQAMATTVHPDGAIATVERRSATELLLPVDVGIALETIQDPGNLGTIIRTAAAAGTGGLWLSADSVDLDHPKVLRASAGQWFQLPMVTKPDLRTLVAHCRTIGMQVVAAVPTAALCYWQIDMKSPTLIVLGNEGGGLSRELAALADWQAKIPVQPEVESLNVAIAAALMLYEARRQREVDTP